MKRGALTAAALIALFIDMPIGIAGSQQIVRDDLRFTVELPDSCRAATGQSRVTFSCMPDPAEVKASDRSKTFALTVYSEPAPADGAWLRLQGIVGETRKIIARHDICDGSDPEAARVHAAYEGSGGPSNNVWGLITGTIICRGSVLIPWLAAEPIFFRQISTKRHRYWITAQYPASIKDAAMRVADQMFFLTFEPLKD